MGPLKAATFRTATTTDVYLGGRPGTTNVFAGLMDEMTIYNRALTVAEIASIAAAGGAGKCTEPDGTPYVYVNGVRAVEDPFTLLSDTPAQAALLSTFPNGTLRYTLDGSAPSNGVLYTGPFVLPDPATVLAIALATNGTPSPAVARTITRLPASAVGPNQLLIASRGPGGVSLVLRGTANRRYVLERSVDLRGWTSVASTIAPLDGIARMKDTSPPFGQAFYRAVGE